MSARLLDIIKESLSIYIRVHVCSVTVCVCVCVCVCVLDRGRQECECDSCVARAVTTDTQEIDTHLYNALTQESADCLQFKPTISHVNKRCQCSNETSSS